MYGYFYDNNNVYLIYELVNKGNLFQYLNVETRINEKQAAHVFLLLINIIFKFIKDISLALLYIKKRNIIHRDLKLENIMIDIEDGVFRLKLSDFGWACQYFDYKRTTLCGTPECIFILI